MRIGVIGTGRMGTAITTRLVGEGLAVSVWNRSPDRTSKAVEAGVKAKGDPIVCEEDQYTQEHIDSDDANIMDFDKAYEEATLVDKLEKRKQIDEQLRDQQQALDAEKAELESQYKKYIEELKQKEEEKIKSLLE